MAQTFFQIGFYEVQTPVCYLTCTYSLTLTQGLISSSLVRPYSGHRNELDPDLGLEISWASKPKGLTLTFEASYHLLFPTAGLTVDSLELWQPHNTSCSHIFHCTFPDLSLSTQSIFPHLKIELTGSVDRSLACKPYIQPLFKLGVQSFPCP